MTRTTAKATPQLLQAEWVPFSGGELEGCRPRALCPECRTKLDKRAHRTLCFHCYRLEIERERALKAAGDLNTATGERFQYALPIEPVNHARLARLKVERQHARSAQAKASPYVDRRRQAQINARHTLGRLAEGLRTYRLAQEQKQAVLHARSAAAPLPEAWLPFVAAR